MGGDVCGDWGIDFFHSMACYFFEINNRRKVWEGSNKGVDWMFPQFNGIKDTIFAFTTK